MHSSGLLLALAAPAVYALPYANSIAAIFRYWEHLGNLTPYWTPDNTPQNLLSGLPDTCSVDKAFVLVRHAARHPISGELPAIQTLSSYINDNAAVFSDPKTTVPSEFNFLSGWRSTFILNNLTAPGRLEAFTNGVNLKLDYPQLSTNTFLVGNQDRVVETAQWYIDGYVGRYANFDQQIQLIGEDSATVSWITPIDTCANWTYNSGQVPITTWGRVYLPRIATRINDLLQPAYPGVNFTADNMHGALWACAYGDAVNGTGTSPWCSVFLPSEFLDFEYELDLLMRGAFGYGLPNDQGPVIGSLLVSNMTMFMLSGSSPSAGANLSVAFGHDTTIDLGMTALGLLNDTSFPAEGPPNPARLWRTSRQVPFNAQMVFQRLSCAGAPNSLGTQELRIQLLMNGANFDLSGVGCRTDKYGTCAFSDFLATPNVRAALAVRHGDARWTAACG